MSFHRHNFFVFPRQELPFDGPSHEFLCQTTSIDFLAKYQFDFNACIHEGILKEISNFLSCLKRVRGLLPLFDIWNLHY